MPIKYPKKKGKFLENYVSDQLRKMFNTDERYIRRSGSSGTQIGEESDIFLDIQILKKFPFQIECKNQENWKMQDLFITTKKSNPFKKYLLQLDKEINRYKEKYKDINLNGLLIFSKQHEQIYCMFRNENNLKQLNLPYMLNTEIDNISYKITLFDDFIIWWINNMG